MLTPNFYAELGGGTSTNNNNYKITYLMSTSKVRYNTSNYLLNYIFHNSNYPIMGTSGYTLPNCQLIGSYTTDTGLTLPDTIYTESDGVCWCTKVTLFPIFDKTTSITQMTGFKLTGTYLNSSTSDKTINCIKLYDEGSSGCILALKMLDAPVTIKPSETFVFEYTFENVYPVIPDTVE